MDHMEYLSDEELLALMDVSESDGLLPAPRELKRNVLAQAQRETAEARQKQKQRQFRIYCLRVAAGMAAAVVLTFSSGPALEHMTENLRSVNTAQQVYQFNDNLQRAYHNALERLGNIEFNWNFGGNDHE